MNTNVDSYFTDGCGRCPLGGTQECKVNNWTEELKLLRRIVLECGLDEQSKWGVPCYTFNNKNVFIISAFKEHCAISFFKGALLSNTHGLLEAPGENSQATRLIKFTDVGQIIKNEALIKSTVFEAVEVEKAGLKVSFKNVTAYSMPDELVSMLDELPALKTAFESLTPGRQKGYILYFSQPKQSKTRVSRIEKCIPKILEGKGLHDRY